MRSILLCQVFFLIALFSCKEKRSEMEIPLLVQRFEDLLTRQKIKKMEIVSNEYVNVFISEDELINPKYLEERRTIFNVTKPNDSIKYYVIVPDLHYLNSKIKMSRGSEIEIMDSRK